MLDKNMHMVQWIFYLKFATQLSHGNFFATAKQENFLLLWFLCKCRDRNYPSAFMFSENAIKVYLALYRSFHVLLRFFPASIIDGIMTSLLTLYRMEIDEVSSKPPCSEESTSCRQWMTGTGASITSWPSPNPVPAPVQGARPSLATASQAVEKERVARRGLWRVPDQRWFFFSSNSRK